VTGGCIFADGGRLAMAVSGPVALAAGLAVLTS